MQIARHDDGEEFVLFDFDGTLTHRDTLLPFLWYASGPLKFIWNAVLLFPIMMAYSFFLVTPETAKGRVFERFFSGRSAEDYWRAGQAFSRDRLPGMLRQDMVDILVGYQRRGARCAIVSASVSTYLRPFAEHMGVDLICSDLVLDQERVTAYFLRGNCNRDQKAIRIIEWMRGKRVRKVTAYGNSKGDLAMFALADEAWFVKKNGELQAIKNPSIS